MMDLKEIAAGVRRAPAQLILRAKALAKHVTASFLEYEDGSVTLLQESKTAVKRHDSVGVIFNDQYSKLLGLAKSISGDKEFTFTYKGMCPISSVFDGRGVVRILKSPIPEIVTLAQPLQYNDQGLTLRGARIIKTLLVKHPNVSNGGMCMGNIAGNLNERLKTMHLDLYKIIQAYATPNFSSCYNALLKGCGKALEKSNSEALKTDETGSQYYTLPCLVWSVADNFAEIAGTTTTTTTKKKGAAADESDA